MDSIERERERERDKERQRQRQRQRQRAGQTKQTRRETFGMAVMGAPYWRVQFNTLRVQVPIEELRTRPDAASDGCTTICKSNGNSISRDMSHKQEAQKMVLPL